MVAAGVRGPLGGAGGVEAGGGDELAEAVHGEGGSRGEGRKVQDGNGDVA